MNNQVANTVLGLVALAADPAGAKKRIDEISAELEQLKITRNAAQAERQAAARDLAAAKEAIAEAARLEAAARDRAEHVEGRAAARERQVEAREVEARKREERLADGERKLAEKQAAYDRAVGRLRSVTATSDAA